MYVKIKLHVGSNYILVVRPPCSVQGTYREANVFLDIIFPDKWPGQVRDMPPTPQTSDFTSLNFRYCLHIFRTSEINVKSLFTGIRNIGLHMISDSGIDVISNRTQFHVFWITSVRNFLGNVQL
jgi:hypothetical protein